MTNYNSIKSVGLVALSLFTLSLAPLQAVRSEEQYPFDIKAKHARALAGYQKILPPIYKKSSWAYNLDGTASPFTVVQNSGKRCLLGAVCKPHDCGDNQLAFLIAEDGTMAVALVRSAALTSNMEVLLGKPTAAQTALLKKQIN